MRVKFTDGTLWKSYLEKITIISAFVTIISVFVSIQNYSAWIQIAILAVACIVLINIFLIMWWKANKKKEVRLKIRNTHIQIKVGDILQFDEEKEFSVITVNEYVDMIADNHLVKKESIHGQFIQKMEMEEKIDSLKEYIANDNENNKKYYSINQTRNEGNNVKHPIGSIMQFESYILAVFAKDDENEQPYLYGKDYMGFLMQFWENIDSKKKTINIPLMGAGVMKFKNGKPDKQALLEIILWSLKLSEYDNSCGGEKVNIIIHENDANEIDFYHLQHNSNFK